MTTSPRRSRREWVRSLEQASLHAQRPVEAAAAARFDALASPARQMALAREIVTTRARELTLAYSNLVMVTAGYRARRMPGGRNSTLAEPCVIFVVKRKWKSQQEAPADQLLPSRLLTHGLDGGAHCLFAVPTDVQPADWYLGGASRALGCVQVEEGASGRSLPGTLTCAVTAQGASAAASGFALSAMHVLSPISAQLRPTAGASITATAGGVRGRTAAWGGFIDANRGRAFDTQLADIEDRAWFNRAFVDWSLSSDRPYVVAHDAFDTLSATMQFRILAPDNHPNVSSSPRLPMFAQFTSMVHQELPLEYQVRFQGSPSKILVRHEELLRLRVLDDCPAPLRGDSGSAIVTWWPDGSLVLVGMFIASGNLPGLERVVYAIPAWLLFDISKWCSLPPGTSALTPDFRLS